MGPPPHVRVRDDGPDDGAVHPDFNDGSAHELTDCRSGGNHLRGGNDGNLYTISPAGATAEYGTVTAPSDATTASLVGLATQAEGTAGFFADNVTLNADSTVTATLDHIPADGSSLSVIGTMGESFGKSNTGNLVFGPDGKLYFDTENKSGVPCLYVVNTTTGALTEVGSGLNTGQPSGTGLERDRALRR